MPKDCRVCGDAEEYQLSLLEDNETILDELIQKQLSSNITEVIFEYSAYRTKHYGKQLLKQYEKRAQTFVHPSS